MTQNGKDLLLQDLCARLPYGVKIDNFGEPSILASINHQYRIIVKTAEIDENSSFNLPKLDVLEIEDVRPYLFPLSSMTEGQYYEMMNCSSEDCLEHMELLKTLRECTDFTHWHLYEYRVIDWFNKNHFDYRGLIPMGLANDATGLNIY